MPSKKPATKSSAPVATNTIENRDRPIAGKLTPPIVSKICDMHASGITLLACCQSNNVSLSGFNTMLRKNPELRDNVFKPAREAFIDVLEEKAFRLATDVDARYPTMLIFMLKAHRREVYGERVQATVSPGGEFAAAFFTAMERASAQSSAAH